MFALGSNVLIRKGKEAEVNRKGEWCACKVTEVRQVVTYDVVYSSGASHGSGSSRHLLLSEKERREEGLPPSLIRAKGKVCEGGKVQAYSEAEDAWFEARITRVWQTPKYDVEFTNTNGGAGGQKEKGEAVPAFAIRAGSTPKKKDPAKSNSKVKASAPAGTEMNQVTKMFKAKDLV
jgi:hypothetical protein